MHIFHGIEENRKRDTKQKKELRKGSDSMGRAGWKGALCWMLLVLFVLAVILYVKNQTGDASMTDATLVRVGEIPVQTAAGKGVSV